ncbi:hypothetical protein [Aneurinibacillus sp. REN35]|uniref:hypothetical protein n=1 Tax=Aneurinibacillus sp. REN35 TaxID=3237286 RepID=UPI0035276807
MKLNAELFLNKIFSENELINFRCLKSGQTSKDIKDKYNFEVINQLGKINEQDYDIYFVVNSGGYKSEEIHKINAVFIDLDCGRDENKNYFSIEIVQQYKIKKLSEIRKFKHRPTAIVETRNGLQIFWKLVAGTTNEQFAQCEELLIKYFDADKQVKNINRIMRVPDYYWCKDPNNKFLATLIEFSNVEYAIQDIIDALPEVEIDSKGVYDNQKYKYYYSIPDTKTPNIDLIKQRDIEKLQTRLNPQSIILHNHKEVYDYLKKRDLHAFLGVYGNSFSCVVHEDSNPSAGIIVNKETEHYVYNCFSDNCGYKGTIIDIAMELTGLDIHDVLRFLRQVYRVEYAETEWQKERKVIIEENKRYIYGEELREKYPNLEKRLKRYINYLFIFNEIAKEKIVTENFTDGDGNPVFFSSLPYIAQRWNKNDEKRTGNIMALFAYLGLIKKLSENEIPDFLLKRARHEAAKKKTKNIVSFYSVPPYDERLLSFAEFKAKEYEEKGFTMKGWSREMLFRALGEDEANRVYPQMKGRKISNYSENLTHEIEQVVFSLIKEKGWVREKEIIENLNYQGKSAHIQTQIKRIIPEMEEKYGLIKARLNKELKAKFSIEIEGYPVIIYQEKQMKSHLLSLRELFSIKMLGNCKQECN